MRPTKELWEAAMKESLPTYQRKSRYERKPVLMKLLSFNYWFNQMEKLIAAVKIFLLT